MEPKCGQNRTSIWLASAGHLPACDGASQTTGPPHGTQSWRKRSFKMPKCKSTALPAALLIHLLHPIPSNNIHHSTVFMATHFLTWLLLSSAAFIVIALLFPYCVCYCAPWWLFERDNTNQEKRSKTGGDWRRHDLTWDQVLLPGLLYTYWIDVLVIIYYRCHCAKDK